jgi:hypothetical protein
MKFVMERDEANRRTVFSGEVCDGDVSGIDLNEWESRTLSAEMGGAVDALRHLLVLFQANERKRWKKDAA